MFPPRFFCQAAQAGGLKHIAPITAEQAQESPRPHLDAATRDERSLSGNRVDEYERRGGNHQPARIITRLAGMAANVSRPRCNGLDLADDVQPYDSKQNE